MHGQIKNEKPANAELLKQNVPNPLCLLGLFSLNNLKYTALDVPGMYIHQFFFLSLTHLVWGLVQANPFRSISHLHFKSPFCCRRCDQHAKP